MPYNPAANGTLRAWWCGDFGSASPPAATWYDESGYGNHLGWNGSKYSAYVSTAGLVKHGTYSRHMFYWGLQKIGNAGLHSTFPGKNGTSNTTWTFCGWIRFHTTMYPSGTNATLFNKNWPGSMCYSLQVQPANGFNAVFYTATPSSHTEKTTTVPDLNKWYHVGWAVSPTSTLLRVWDDDAGAIFYSNGTTFASDPMRSTDSEFVVARTAWVDEHVNAYCDDWQFHNIAMNEDEIDAIRMQLYPDPIRNIVSIPPIYARHYHKSNRA